MTTLDRPTSRPRSGTGLTSSSLGSNNLDARTNPEGQLSPQQERQRANTFPGDGSQMDDLLADVRGGVDLDSSGSYSSDGFTPASTEKCGASDPQDSIDLEGLAEQVYLLLLREVYIERERLGARR